MLRKKIRVKRKVYYKPNPDEPNIYKNVREIITNQVYLFRGTNSSVFQQREKEGSYYGFFDRESTSAFVTCATPSLLSALETGREMCDGNGSNRLLLAINATKYSMSAYPTEKFNPPKSYEIEIWGKIGFSSITVIDSLDKLQQFMSLTSPHFPQNADPKIPAEFQRYYIIPPSPARPAQE